MSVKYLLHVDEVMSDRDLSALCRALGPIIPNKLALEDDIKLVRQPLLGIVLLQGSRIVVSVGM